MACVIFLDIDGVLHPADGDATELFRPSCLQRLAALCHRSASELVLSSSWRLEDRSLAEVRSRLATVGLKLLSTTRCDTTLGPSSRAQDRRRVHGMALAMWLKAMETSKRPRTEPWQPCHGCPVAALLCPKERLAKLFATLKPKLTRPKGVKDRPTQWRFSIVSSSGLPGP